MSVWWLVLALGAEPDVPAPSDAPKSAEEAPEDGDEAAKSAGEAPESDGDAAKSADEAPEGGDDAAKSADEAPESGDDSVGEGDASEDGEGLPEADAPPPNAAVDVPEAPDEPTDEERALAAEARRLRQELVKVARVGRHEAVDRLYRDLVELALPIPDDIHVFGADSARALGDMMHCVARLHRGGGDAELADVAGRFGTVRLSVTAPDVQITGPERFAPDETNALSWANDRLAVDGRFVGMLPAGEYELANRVLVVPAGGAVSVVID